MSRSNTHYYNLCYHWGPVGEDGYCDFHRTGWARGKAKCIPPGEFATRRGMYRRKPRFPERSSKSYHNGPSRWIKRIWQRRLRLILKYELQRHGEILTDAQKWLGGKYGNY